MDIVYNKAEAGRKKDIEYLAAVFHAGIAAPSIIEEALDRYGEQLLTVQVAKVRKSVDAATHWKKPSSMP